MRVVVADDHALLREGFVGFFKVHHPTWDVLQADNARDLQAILQESTVDMVIIDLKMPGMDGVDTLSGLRSRHPATKIAVLTANDDRSTILESLAAGVHGYILKSAGIAELLLAVETIMRGTIYVPAMLSQVCAAQPASVAVHHAHAQARAPATAPLTARQRDVMVLLAQGLPTKVIARRLSLGVGTVKVHLAALYRTLNVHSRMEAVVKSGAMLDTADTAQRSGLPQ